MNSGIIFARIWSSMQISRRIHSAVAARVTRLDPTNKSPLRVTAQDTHGACDPTLICIYSMQVWSR